MTVGEYRDKLDFLIGSGLVSKDEKMLVILPNRNIGFIEGVTVPPLQLDGDGCFEYVQMGFGHIEH